MLCPAAAATRATLLVLYYLSVTRKNTPARKTIVLSPASRVFSPLSGPLPPGASPSLGPLRGTIARLLGPLGSSGLVRLDPRPSLRWTSIYYRSNFLCPSTRHVRLLCGVVRYMNHIYSSSGETPHDTARQISSAGASLGLQTKANKGNRNLQPPRGSRVSHVTEVTDRTSARTHAALIFSESTGPPISAVHLSPECA
jgi:hypothetical protein